MASLPEPQFEEERGKFDAEQQKLLETIADTEEVLEAAERIGVLIKGTKEKIEAVFESEKVSHKLLFQGALAKERSKPGESEGAFGRAFEAVYGRFLFEQQTEEVKNPQSRFARMLSKVLSNRIEAPDSTIDAAERKSLIALRSELQAVAKRLHMLDTSATEGSALLMKQLEDFKTLFVGQRAAIESFKTPQIEAAVAGVAALCDAYLTNLAVLEGKNSTDLTLAEINAFAETHRAFLHDLKQLFDNAPTAKGAELDSVKQQIADLEKETGMSEFLAYKIAKKMEKGKVGLRSKLADARSRKSHAERTVQANNKLYRHLRPVENALPWLNQQISGETKQQDIRDQIARNSERISALNERIQRLISSNHGIDELSKINPDDVLTLDSEDIERMRPLMGEIEFSRNILGIPFNKKLTAALVEKSFRTLVAKFDEKKYADQDNLKSKVRIVSSLLIDAKAILEQAIVDGKVGPIEDPVGRFIKFKGELAKKTGANEKLQKRLDKLAASRRIEGDVLTASLDALLIEIDKIQNDGDADAEVKNLCAEYKTAYERFKGTTPPLRAEHFEAFVRDILAPFLSQISAKFNSQRTAANDLTSKAGSEIDLLERQLRELDAKKPSDWVLEQALPGVKIEGDVVKIRGFETNFRHVAKILREAQVYFESPEEVPKVRDLYQNLVNLTGKTGERLSSAAASSLDDLMRKARLDPAKSINSQLPKLRQQIQSKKDQKLSKPSSTDIRKGVEAKQRAHQNNPTLRNTPFDEAQATREVTDSYIKSMADVNDGLDEEISNLDQIRETLEEVMQKAKEFHERMAKFVNNLEVAGKADVKIKKTDGSQVDIAEIVGRFKKISLKSADFSVDDLMAIYYDLGGYFESDTNVSNFADSIRKAQEEIAKSTNLSDATAAKKLLGVMINEQNPDMSLPDQQKLASMILANDVATIQTEASYAELAKRGSAEVLDTVQQAGFNRKLIGFQYKEGDKAVQPFKGLKPGQFNDWAEIERLFKIGRLNHQNGFFVLAAMKEFAPTDAEGRAIPQIQAVKLEKKLKAALAEELGVDERMDEAGIDKILNKAFADQMKKADELVKAYFQHFDRNVDEWNGNKIKELNLRYARVREELRLGKISDATFQKRMAELVDEAKETEVLDKVEFSQDSAMAGYWDSPFSQWFRDRGWDIGQYAKGKAKSLALSGLKLGAFGLWGATKLGLSATLQTALLPLRAAKYPLLLAAKPLIGVINLFRSQKWTPLPTIRDTIRSDAGRVVGYFATKGSETWKGTVEKGTGVPKAEWAKNPWATKKYSERTKVDLGSLKEQADELKTKGDATPVEVAGSPFIDLKKYRDEIAKLDKILAQKPAEERGGSASGEARAAA